LRVFSQGPLDTRRERIMELAAAHPNRDTPAGFEKRGAPRSKITASVAFSCFTAGDTHRIFHGTVRNFSEGGLELDSNKDFSKGSILLIRLIKCPFHRLAPEVTESIRTILLAEVKWVRYFEDVRGNRCRMGVHYF
jgi:hypothetical protein